MPRQSEGLKKRYPLHITLSAAFTSLLLLFGFSLIAFGYLESRKIALLGAEETIERVGAQLHDSVTKLYAPAQNLVDLSSRTLPSGDRPLGQRLVWLGFLTESLKLNPRVSTIFVGYDDGDFLLVRRLTQPADDGPAPPPGARFVVQSIERDDAQLAREELIFFDEQLEPLGRQSREWTGFDPRQREWFATARGRTTQIVSDTYVFFTTREVGVTIARMLQHGGGVVGVDLALSDLATGLADQRITPSSRLALLEPGGGVIALSDASGAGATPGETARRAIEMPTLSDLADPLYRALARRLDQAITGGTTELRSDGRRWLVTLATLPVRGGEPILLAHMVPRDELLIGVTRVRDHSVMISIALLLVALIFVVRVSRHVSGSLRRLAGAAEGIRALRLDTPLDVRSKIEEVDDLAVTMSEMKASLEQFLAISQSLSAEKEFSRLLERILSEARRVTGAAGGAILLLSEDERRLEFAILHDPSTGERRDATDSDGERRGAVVLAEHDRAARQDVDSRTALGGVVVRIDDISTEQEFDVSALRNRYERNGGTVRSLLSVPLRTQKGEVIGVLQLVNATVADDRVEPFPEEAVPYMEALSSSAAVALDNRRLLKAQRDLLESFIHVVAGAIDAKSPYTHGHCQRVPVLARMLAESAHQAEVGPFADFSLSDDEWYELHLASWLHDCGKVTTPEYVVDKATRLETIYNRIHEIRMRFEVLWREAEIAQLKALARGSDDREALDARLHTRQSQIRDDFAFVARQNLGNAPATEEDGLRLEQIARQTWIRQLDDRLGLSHGELARLEQIHAPELPVAEPLLADRPEHIVPRPAGGESFERDPQGFRMEIPENLYNHGEIHNLRIPRGTLTEEERFKINEHIIQTIRMLGRLPFPRELRRVPEWAGNHHEKLDGSGYPRQLARDELSIPARIMAIADIFEALTAADRPYMPPKKLSQAVRIMASMRDSGHICPQLFELFLRSGVHANYAAEHLRPQQIDEIGLDEVLARPKGDRDRVGA